MSSKLDPKISHCVDVVTERLQAARELGGQRNSADCREASDLVGTEYRKDARCDRRRHAERAGHVLKEFEVVGVGKEQLGQDELGAMIQFVLYTLPVDMSALRAGDVAFWKTGCADRKVTVALDEVDELERVLEPVVG